MRFPCLPGLIVVALITAARLPAQPPVFLRVVDSTSGAPIRRAHVRIAERWRSTGDTTGVIRVDSVPAGRFLADVICRPPRGWYAGPIEGQQVLTAPARGDTLVVRLDGQQCHQGGGPLRRVRLRGYLASGFEYVRFQPCPSSAVALPTGLQHLAADSVFIWVSSAPWTRRPPQPWPPAEPASSASGPYPRRYETVEGTLEGPGRFGHMGGSQYELEIDAILAVDAPRPDWCARP